MNKDWGEEGSKRARRRMSFRANGVDTALAVGALLAGGLWLGAATTGALVLKRRVLERRKERLSKEDWQSLEDAEGRIADPGLAIELVRERGLEEEARECAWPRILGVLPMDSTRSELDHRIEELREDFESQRQLVKEWQEAGVADFNAIRRVVWLDSCRTPLSISDPSALRDPVASEEHPGERRLVAGQNIEGERLRWVRSLAAILEAQAAVDEELGYSQGMNEVAAAFVANVSDLAVAFACFSRFVEKFKTCFFIGQSGVDEELLAVGSVVRSVDPKLHRHIKALSCDDFSFAYRMMAVLLQRELGSKGAARLWERLFVEDASFIVYAVAAAVIQRRKEFLKASHASDIWVTAVSQGEPIDPEELVKQARHIRDLDWHTSESLPELLSA